MVTANGRNATRTQPSERDRVRHERDDDTMYTDYSQTHTHARTHTQPDIYTDTDTYTFKSGNGHGVVLVVGHRRGRRREQGGTTASTHSDKRTGFIYTHAHQQKKNPTQPTPNRKERKQTIEPLRRWARDPVYAWERDRDRRQTTKRMQRNRKKINTRKMARIDKISAPN